MQSQSLKLHTFVKIKVTSFQTMWPCLFCFRYLSLTPDPPRNDWPALGQPGLPTPHFYRQGLGQPVPQPPTFIDRAQASPAPNLSLLLANPSLLLANPSLLLARPLTSIGKTPPLY